MKTKFFTLFATCILFISIVPFQSFAQAPDTVDVPFMIDNNPIGAINKFILGDTTVNGERNNINRVYKLGRGLIYFFDSVMEAHFPLTLIADDDDPNNPTSPPLLAPGILQDNSSPNSLIWAYENTTFKNLYVTGIRPDEERLNWSIGVRLYGDNCRYVFDNCVFEGWGFSTIRQYCSHAKVYITDCHFRNSMHPTSFLGGSAFVIQAGVPTDSVVMRNNTQFNCGSYFFCPNREFTNYSLIEHNTIFTTHGNVFYAPWLHNSYYKNNIIYGVHAMGQHEIETLGGWTDWDGELSAIVSIDTIPSDIAAREGIAEADRIVHYKNNAYYWPQKMVDFWASADTLDPALWINDRTQSMLDDNISYPGFLVEGNLNVDPGFNSSLMALVDDLMTYCTQNRNGTQTNFCHYYYGEGNPPLLFPPVWPLPENLEYSNTELLTAGTDGFPVGDLNWFPDKKAEWQTNVEIKSGTLPAEFELSQNYPNPFNPETTIKFNLKKSAHIKLTVYNMLGQKVKTLVNEKIMAGSHIANWNAKDATGNMMTSGIYYYRIESESFKATKKMLLLR